jgi:tRNA/rRNA methyltransferase
VTPCSIRNRSNDVLAASVASRYSTYMAGTEKTRAAPHSMSPAVVLVNPQLGENIGTAIRAMANFGLSELRIVDPRDGWPSEKAISAAAGADWIIESTRVYDRLEDALLDVNHVYATTARPRGLVKEVLSP